MYVTVNNYSQFKELLKKPHSPHFNTVDYSKWGYPSNLIIENGFIVDFGESGDRISFREALLQKPAIQMVPTFEELEKENLDLQKELGHQTLIVVFVSRLIKNLPFKLDTTYPEIDKLIDEFGLKWVGDRLELK